MLISRQSGVPRALFVQDLTKCSISWWSSAGGTLRTEMSTILYYTFRDPFGSLCFVGSSNTRQVRRCHISIEVTFKQYKENYFL